MVARTAPFIRATGRLERRDANMNVLIEGLWRLERPDLELADVRAIDPPARREPGQEAPGDRDAQEAPQLPAAVGFGDLGAAMPPPHSFGRRGR
jgi:hypothetical protein